MTVSFGIDTRHLATEEPTVGGGVAEVVDSDVIMDHLMENGVFDEVFGQVHAGIDAENKVLIAGCAEEPGAMLGEGQFPQECAGMGKLDRDGRKPTAEEAGVVLVKAGLYVGDGWDHSIGR